MAEKSFFNWFKRADSEPDVQERSLSFPDKVFIEKSGPFYEYSQDIPPLLSPTTQLEANIYNLLNGYYAPQNFIRLFYTLPEVFAPVHEIAKRVSDGCFQLVKSWNDEIDGTDETFNRLFTQPNPLVSFKDLLYQAVCYEILTGRQFFYFNRPSTLPNEYKSILSWYNLPAQNVWVEQRTGVDPYTITKASDIVQDYRSQIGERTRIFEADKVLPICHLALENGYDMNQCRPLLLGAEKAIRNLIPVYEARGVIYIKRGAMGFLVSNKSDTSGNVPLTPKEKASVNQTVNETYGLRAGQSTIGVTEQPLSFVKTSMSISEMQPFDETLADAVAIYACLRVPRHLVPSKDSSTFANADADLKAFYDNVIIPWGARYAESWTNFLGLQSSRRYIKADYSHIAVMQENRKTKADVEQVETNTWKIRFDSGLCSLNDWSVGIELPKSADPIADKRIFEMSDEEIIKVKGMFRNTQTAAATPAQESATNTPVIPINKAANG